MHEFEKLLQQLEEVSEESDSVSVADIRRHLGSEAFGPALLTLGIIALSRSATSLVRRRAVMSAFIVLIARGLWIAGMAEREDQHLVPVHLGRGGRAKAAPCAARPTRRRSRKLAIAAEQFARILVRMDEEAG